MKISPEVLRGAAVALGVFVAIFIALVIVAYMCCGGVIPLPDAWIMGLTTVPAGLAGGLTVSRGWRLGALAGALGVLAALGAPWLFLQVIRLAALRRPDLSGLVDALVPAVEAAAGGALGGLLARRRAAGPLLLLLVVLVPHAAALGPSA